MTLVNRVEGAVVVSAERVAKVSPHQPRRYWDLVPTLAIDTLTNLAVETVPMVQAAETVVIVRGSTAALSKPVQVQDD